MRKKSKYPKVQMNIRIREDVLKKVDEIADKKEIERSELLRKIIENYIVGYEF